MSDWDLTDDEVLLGLLHDALDEVDPVPSSVVVAALAAFDMIHLDDELATLVADSLSDATLLVRHQGPTERLLTFTAPALTLEVGLPAAEATVFGAIVPPVSAVVEVETTSGTIRIASDAMGRFHSEVGPGRCRLRVRLPDAAIVTPWISR